MAKVCIYVYGCVRVLDTPSRSNGWANLDETSYTDILHPEMKHTLLVIKIAKNLTIYIKI